MITPKQKASIDAMTYEAMLRLHRFEPLGSPMFLGDSGEYFMSVMASKKPLNHVAISKRIGWEK